MLLNFLDTVQTFLHGPVMHACAQAEHKCQSEMNFVFARSILAYLHALKSWAALISEKRALMHLIILQRAQFWLLDMETALNRTINFKGLLIGYQTDSYSSTKTQY